MLITIVNLLSGGHVDAMPSHPGAQPHQVHLQPKGGKPLWVLNGRVYNYRKEGASPAPNQAAADELVAMQKAEKDGIQGLAAGGNKPPQGNFSRIHRGDSWCINRVATEKQRMRQISLSVILSFALFLAREL